MRLGDLELKLVSDGGFRLDGGAMFGVVPRTLWERVKPPDERNRIRMATNCLLVARGSELLLIDSGIGDKHDARFRDMFGMEPGAVRLPEAIRRAGYTPEQVTHVLLTHLHFDHCGWNTRRAAVAPAGHAAPAAPVDSGEELVPTFPNAVYWLERGEVEHARHPNERDRASYDPRNWEPLFAAGVVRLYDGDPGCEPIPGVRAVRAAGHNADMCIVLLDGGAGSHGSHGSDGSHGSHGSHGSDTGGDRLDSAEAADFGGKAVFFADLVPTVAHVAYPWIMSYDLYPMTTLENKKIWVPRAAAGGWLAIFQHETEAPLGKVVQEKPGRFRAEPLAVAGAAASAAAPATSAATSVTAAAISAGAANPSPVR
ncbi:MAG TPA: MBL fold metallo-hydrolase [Thermoanaerobaculia bacterium]|jgi:glyoxylase-like metal-dependent hydrolase (beta-lactamase superfamily II)|nr:MBL fold metallo-hydrolase [Thermoanaerobaculia bacterium]